VVLTFSRGAAEQIRDRLNSLALAEYPNLAGIDVRTIHSLGRRVLRLAASSGKSRVRPGFQVVAEGRKSFDKGRPVTAPLPFIDHYDRLFDGIDDGLPDRRRLELYPSAINALRNGHPDYGVVTRPEGLLPGRSVTVLNPRTGNLTELEAESLAQVWRRYDDLMTSHNAIDFPGMVTEALVTIRAHPALAALVGAPYEHIFVDEFQDTSLAQNDLLFELAAQGAVLSCVGDGDQTIFSFAGADPESLTGFAERLHRRTSRAANVLPLEYNYRSSPDIVAVAESVIAKNNLRL
jgi:DNA helicase-2/ATP-dependent DNA helicase PcrA